MSETELYFFCVCLPYLTLTCRCSMQNGMYDGVRGRMIKKEENKMLFPLLDLAKK